jgi:hypothetical protein
MTGKELIRKLRKAAHRARVEFYVEADRGKGDHQTIYWAGRLAVLPGLGEIKTGTLHGILKDLGIRLDDLRR